MSRNQAALKGCHDAALWRLGRQAAEAAAALGCFDAAPDALADAAAAFVDAIQRGGRSLAAAKGTPGHLQRAEAYLHAHATEPVQMRDVAAACNCSVRLLQLDFRRVRGLSPSAALRVVRLERARADLLAGDGPVAAVAQRYLFSNAGRFAAAYAGRFGEMPAQTRQGRREMSVERKDKKRSAKTFGAKSPRNDRL